MFLQEGLCVNKKVTSEMTQRVVRREQLIKLIREMHPQEEGVLFLCAGFERDREPFFQDSSFHYFGGIDEPALMLYQPLGGDALLYEPQYATDRSVWLPLKKDTSLLHEVGISKTVFLGSPVAGYSSDPFFSKKSVSVLVEQLTALVEAQQFLFTPLSEVTIESLIVLNQLYQYVPGLQKQVVDIAPLIGKVRRKKDIREIEHMYKAIEITAAAQEGAAESIEAGSSEARVQAAIDYVFAEGHAVRAFPSIVGSGKNSTVLHYVDNKAVMADGDVVVVDIGASYQHYAADITRTYPVSGTFSQRQKEIYQCVLDAQTFVAEAAAPGMYLNNPEHPEKSLHHIAQNFFKDQGYASYFPHGIGHFVGLDVHDVGDRREPLQPGDVITIEPGLYIPEEKLGVRIEDMYWIVEDGVVCLTEGIAKEIIEIEELMHSLRGDE
jgi:Xaa-Pro aminopeptidase